MTAIPFHELARVVSEHMLNGIAAGMVLALFAWALLRLAGRQNSSTRFAVWFAVLVAIAALPFVGKLAQHAQGLDTASTAASAISLPASWAVGLVLAWAVVVAVGLSRLVVGLVKLRQLRAISVPVDLTALDPLLRQTLQDFRSRRQVTLCVSDQQRVPAAIGFFQPLIVLPSWTMRELSREELNSILIHELAHLRRWDDWTNLLQKICRTLFFFHPAVWWVESQLSLEREMACDDVVLSHTGNPRAYAECLVSMAEKSFLHRTLALTQAAVSRMRQTSHRVAQILDAQRPGATRVWKPALGLVTTFAVICGISQLRAPELVAFRDGEPAASAVAAASVVQPSVQLASFRRKTVESRPAEIRKASLSKPIVARKPARIGTPVAIEARLNEQSGAAMTQAKPAFAPETPIAAQTMLVVFHSQQYSFTGQVRWTVWVWRVSVQPPIETRVPAKRT